MIRVTTDDKDRAMNWLKSDDCKFYVWHDLKPKFDGFDVRVEALKIIIDWEQDLENGFSLTFSEDYTKILKSYNEGFIKGFVDLRGAMDFVNKKIYRKWISDQPERPEGLINKNQLHVKSITSKNDHTKIETGIRQRNVGH